MFIDDVVCDVAASAAGDEDLGAEGFRAVNKKDGRARVCGVKRAAQGNGGHEPCGSGSEDDGIGTFGVHGLEGTRGNGVAAIGVCLESEREEV